MKTRSAEARKTELRNAHESVEMAKTKDESKREPELDPFMGTSGNIGGTKVGKSFRTGCELAPGNVVIGFKPAQIPPNGSSWSTQRRERRTLLATNAKAAALGGAPPTTRKEANTIHQL